MRMIGCRTLGAAALVLSMGLAGGASAQEKLQYLFPAPSFLVAFAPFQIATIKGYYKQAGLEPEFLTGRGGADTAKQVGAGNVDLGGGVGDTAIIVRPNGVPVKPVAILGGRSLMQLVVRDDANIKTPADLKGKTIAIQAFQDTTFYSLLGVMATAGLKKEDANIQAVGPANTMKMIITGEAQALAAVPDWIGPIQAAGIKITVFPSETFFPNMAQAIIASEDMIKKKPAMIKKFVGATLKGMKDVMDDPAAAAKLIAANIPEWKDKDAAVTGALTYYANTVYPGQKVLDMMDVERLTKLQDFYVAQQIIPSKTPINDLYTNEFIQ